MKGTQLKGFKPRPLRNESHPQGESQTTLPLPNAGKIYTFYSFKGGVGRSMSLANIAVLLAAQGKRVLVVDFDLEAPGLEHFFYEHDPGLAGRLAKRPGLIDLLRAKTRDWADAVETVQVKLDQLSFSKDTPQAGVGKLDLLASGRASRNADTYTREVQELNWDRLYEDNDVGTLFGYIRADWLAQYDFVLVDSRTGVTDIGDLCTVVLPDHLVLLFVTNEQNIEGVAHIYHRAVTEHARQPFKRDPLTVLPVLSRDEFYAENKLSSEWRAKAAERLAPLLHWLPNGLKPVNAFRKVFIPYFAVWSFGEALPVLTAPQDTTNPSSINAAYARIARLILSGLDWSALDAVADPEELSSARLENIALEAEAEELKERLENELSHEKLMRDEMVKQIALEYEAKSSHNALFRNFLVALVTTSLVFAGYFGYSAQLNREETLLSEEQLIQVQEALGVAETRISEMQKDLEFARERVEEAESILAAQSRENSTVQNELQSLNSELREQIRETASCESIVSDLSRRYTESRAELLSAAPKYLSPFTNNCSGILGEINRALPPLE